MEVLIKKFVHYITHEKRMSRHTITSYITDLNQFQSYCQQVFEIKQISNLTPNEIRSWLVYLKDEGVSTRTLNRKISTLKSFFNYLKKLDIVLENPMLKIIAPKSSKKLPVYFSDKNMKVLFDYLQELPRNFNNVRDHLVLEILYGTGIRLSELIEIKESNIHANEIKVLGKRNKERFVTITSKVSEVLAEYKNLKNSIKTTNPDYLLLTNKGNKLYPKFVYRLVNNYISYISSETKKSPHTLRHSFATNLLNEGAKLHVIKDALGHTNLNATEIYTHNSIARLKEAYKKFHPKEKNSNN